MNQDNFIRDAVCGMYFITTDGCKVSEINNKKYYFCCDTCKEEFDNHMEKYVNILKKNEKKSSAMAQSFYRHIHWERDPVCGDRINISEAKGITLYKNSRYYFCCKICKKTFDANPSIYADKEEELYDPQNLNDNLDGRFRIL